MPDKHEAQQQALDNLRNAMERCIQEGILLSIIEHENQHRLDIVIKNVDWSISNRTLIINMADS